MTMYTPVTANERFDNKGTWEYYKRNSKLSPCLTKHHAIYVWGSGGIDSLILNLGTRWRRLVSFTARPLYSRGRSPRYPLDSRLYGPKSRTGCGGEEKNPYPCRKSNPGRPARSLVTILTEVPRVFTNKNVITKVILLFLRFSVLSVRYDSFPYGAGWC